MYKCYFYWFMNKEATVFLPVSPPSPFSHKPSVPTSQYTPPLLLRKGQVCQEYQQNMKYQFAVTIRTSPIMKTEQGNLVWAIIPIPSWFTNYCADKYLIYTFEERNFLFNMWKVCYIWSHKKNLVNRIPSYKLHFTFNIFVGNVRKLKIWWL